MRRPAALRHAQGDRVGVAAVGWFSAPDYWLSRLVFLRALAVIYVIAFLVAAKMANVGVPVLLKHLVDALDLKNGDPRAIPLRP